MGKISKRPGRAKRIAPEINIRTDARNVSPNYRYKDHTVDPGSGVRRQFDPFELRGSHSQRWVDSSGFDHPTRKDALAHSPAARGGDWHPKLQRL